MVLKAGCSGPRLVGLTVHDTQDLIADADQGRLVGCLDVEPQQRLGVRRTQVEPPAVAADGQPIDSPERLAQTIGRHSAGDSVKLLVFGGGTFRDLAVELLPSP